MILIAGELYLPVSVRATSRYRQRKWWLFITCNQTVLTNFDFFSKIMNNDSVFVSFGSSSRKIAWKTRFIAVSPSCFYFTNKMSAVGKQKIHKSKIITTLKCTIGQLKWLFVFFSALHTSTLKYSKFLTTTLRFKDKDHTRRYRVTVNFQSVLKLYQITIYEWK